MSLDDLEADLETVYADLEDASVELDQETRQELAMLVAAMDPEDPGELLKRGIHLLFQTAVDTGKLDFHLRSAYDVTYDEYLMDMTMDTYNGVGPEAGDTDDRRYQF